MTRAHLLITTALLALTVLPACATRTPIYTRPDSANVVTEDGRELGKTPILLVDRPWAWTSHTLTFTREGYEPATLELDASINPAGVAACGIGACMIWMFWPICLFGNYREEEYVVTLKQRGGLNPMDAFGLPSHSLPQEPLLDEDAPLISFTALKR